MSNSTLELKDVKVTPDIIHAYSRNLTNSAVPLVIDNGSYQCRAGWAINKEPMLIFKNLLAKPRKERGKKDGETQVGNDIPNIEAVRFLLKTQFDKNVVTHYEVQEQVFDYLFTHLGIDTEGYVGHPVVITETYLNPNYSRQLMSELLFECYRVPSICYGVDGLFSYNYNCSKESDGLIINIGYYTTHIIPVLNGRIDANNSRRINLGGSHIVWYLYRLLQLKYPAHFNAITLSRIEALFHDQCYIAVDYIEELNKWADADYYEENVRRIQLPYTAPVSAQGGLNAEQQKERRKELARRLTEINARKREERLAEDEEQLNQLLAAQDLFEEGEEEEFQHALESFELSNATELQKQISTVQARIEKTKQKIVAVNTADDSVIEDTRPKPSKAAFHPKEEEDLDTWLEDVRQKRQELIDRRNAKRQRRQDMARRRTAAAQERMRLISQLARKEKRDDNFGMHDEDWDVYKAISKDGGDSDSDEEQKILELDEVLRQYDPEFEGMRNSSEDTAETHQLHVGIERIRAPEILFQPSMIGSIQAGLSETIEFMLRKFPADIQNTLVSNVFITGSCAAIPGLLDRLHKEFMEMRPFQSTFHIKIAGNPTLDAWHGARAFALSPELQSSLITRQDYEENGGEYFKEHFASNLYFPSPSPLPQTEIPGPSVSEDIEIELF